MESPQDPARMRAESSRGRSASPTRKKKACQYCFRRKMKCDMLEPACTNCINNHKECIPVSRVSKPRPTNDRIQQLESEVNRLVKFLRSISHVPPEQAAQALEKWERSGQISSTVVDGDVGDGGDWESSDLMGSVRSGSVNPVNRPFPGESRPTSPVNRIRYDRIGRVSAHGPTSAFFDDLGEKDFGAFEISPEQTSATVSETELKERATARAAEERHMEILNLASGRLDFDGVPADLAMHLLALHWNRQHFAFLISYRPLFTRDMATQGPYFSKLLLNAIFFSVSKFSERPEVYDDPSDQKTAGKRFLRRIKELLGEALDQSTIPTIQAMLLLSSSLFALGNQSAAWLYSGIAIRMIFDLGLHHDTLHRAAVPSLMTAEEVEIRRRVVWAAFICDKVISLYQGRAVSFDEDKLHVPHRFLDRYEEQELWTPFAFPGIQRYPGAPARAISTFASLCSLSVIMGRIITYIYAEQVLPGQQPVEHLRRLSSSLDRWKTSIPLEIAFDPTSHGDLVPPPHVLSLHAMYYTLVTLLHRPFVEAGHHRLTDPNVVEISWTRCEEAAKGATSVLSRYRQTFTLARAPYLISYTTYVAATIHVRIAAQRGSNSEAAKLLAVCLDALQENSATNPGVRKMYSTISGVMTRLGVQLSSPGTIESNGYPSTEAVFPENIDLSAIIRSFGTDPNLATDQQNFAFTDMNFGTMPVNPTDPQLQIDNLYGFLGFE